PLPPPLLAGSSNRPGSIRRAVLLPYLVLLRAGFCLPPMLPPARCALTAPFHPCSPFGGRYVFCATVLRVAPTGSYPAHCPAEFGLSSRLLTKTSDRLTRCDPHYCSLPGSAVSFLRNLILLKLLVQIAAGGVDRFGCLGDVPAVLPELADKKRALGVVLELAQGADPGLVRRRAPGIAVGSRRRRHTHRPGHLDGLRQIRGVDDV